jgi:hypothetical protein
VHGVSNSHVPFQLGYRPRNIRKKQKAPTFVGASEIESELGNLRLRLANNQTNPEGRARLTRRLIMDLVCIVIFVMEYSTDISQRNARIACLRVLADCVKLTGPAGRRTREFS